MGRAEARLGPGWTATCRRAGGGGGGQEVVSVEVCGGQCLTLCCLSVEVRAQNVGPLRREECTSSDSMALQAAG